MATELLELIEGEKINELSKKLQSMNHIDIAKSMIELDDRELLLVFRLLTKDISVEVFSYLDKKSQKRIIELITDNEVKDIIEKLFLDDTVDIIEELPANIVGKIITNTSLEKRQLINQFLKYKEDSAGAIMTIEFVEFKEQITIKEAIDNIREIGINKESIDNCFIIDNKRVLKGILSLRDLILSSENSVLSEVMETNIVSVKTSEDQEKVAELFKTYDLLSMPVVDAENRLVGIITVDDIVDIIEQENTEDFQKMAAMEPNEEPYLETTVFTLAKHRIVWLLVLMISATFTGAIIQKFEDVIQSVVVLASFIPMLMDTGGNAGSQSATLVIRGLALGEIKTKDYLKVIFKEFRVSILVALVLSLVNFIRIYFFTKVSFTISLTVCISLFLTVILAKVIGGILPIISKKLKLDPAIMASPLITTIVDTFALMVYFALAKLLLGI
ncbi:magnesium transporter [Clostridium sp. NSJ-6]|uniref:Magnesium transporter MgtE n=1 Tax=Clostridium hominis TaxID=2763036 RepID=A0ABR7D923_9CLOT|nr:magnesium transporter [Clostridium hominis]MBC5627880.1 magnesium transporter [Clostridium hominis]